MIVQAGVKNPTCIQTGTKARVFVIFFSVVQPLKRSQIKSTIESGIDVGQGINVGPVKFGKNNKYRALNKRRASEF